MAGRFIALATDTVGSFGGSVTGTWGDEVLAEFDSPRDAVRAAVALQSRCVASTVADTEAPLIVGMGLDVGEASAQEEAGSTLALNVAARLCARAAPGEVLTTVELVHLAGAVPDVVFEERGLRG